MAATTATPRCVIAAAYVFPLSTSCHLTNVSYLLLLFCYIVIRLTDLQVSSLLETSRHNRPASATQSQANSKVPVDGALLIFD